MQDFTSQDQRDWRIGQIFRLQKEHDELRKQTRNSMGAILQGNNSLGALSITAEDEQIAKKIYLNIKILREMQDKIQLLLAELKDWGGSYEM